MNETSFTCRISPSDTSSSEFSPLETFPYRCFWTNITIAYWLFFILQYCFKWLIQLIVFFYFHFTLFKSLDFWIEIEKKYYITLLKKRFLFFLTIFTLRPFNSWGISLLSKIRKMSPFLIYRCQRDNRSNVVCIFFV